MLKTPAAAIMSVTLVAVAQPALADEVVTNQSVSLLIVIPRTSTAPAKAIFKTGPLFGSSTMEWSFNASGTAAAAGATVNGTQVAPASLSPGMQCTLSGTKLNSGVNVITKLAC